MCLKLSWITCLHHVWKALLIWKFWFNKSWLHSSLIKFKLERPRRLRNSLCNHDESTFRGRPFHIQKTVRWRSRRMKVSEDSLKQTKKGSTLVVFVVRLRQHAASSEAGKTQEELFPDTEMWIIFSHMMNFFTFSPFTFYFVILNESRA